MNKKTTRYDLSDSWRELRLFSWYRLFLSIVLFSLHNLALPPLFLGNTLPNIYANVCLIYIILSCIFFVLTHKEWGAFQSLTVIQMLTDIMIIVLLIHSSGGLQTGLGSLLVVVIVVSGAIIPGRMAIFISAVATLALLFQAFYSQIVGVSISDYSHAGILGAALFITALLSQSLSGKLLQNHLLVEQREQDVKKLAMLNEHIISRMQTGVIVVSPTGTIHLSNQASISLLGPIPHTIDSAPVLSQWCPQLAQQLGYWMQHSLHSFEPFQAQSELPQVLASAMRLDSDDVVLYIENTSSTAQQVQQLKLASLGRLTASIAHEIRNPLGAISHAGELLAERNASDQQATKLTDIIGRHTARVNGIIDTILTMSRRNKVQPKVVVLATWLAQFMDEFSEYHAIDKELIRVSINAPLATVFIDPEQLHQIILNLVDNAWHYSNDNKPGPRIEIVLSMIKNDAIIDVSDNGPGVEPSALSQLFEPFYSERTGGTGLGLYLARELAQANGAWLNYVPDNQQRSCFRMVIPMKNREQLE